MIQHLIFFESQYIVPHGVSYNSYLILDEKIAKLWIQLMQERQKEWFDNLDKELFLKERVPDYLIVSHLEPDHLQIFNYLQKSIKAKLVLGAKQKRCFLNFLILKD